MLTVLALGLLPTTWIVDAAAGPGSHFTDLPAAIAAAADGDTILVRSGSYSSFAMTGRTLTIRGAGIGATIVNGSSHVVTQTPAGTVDVFSGMTIHGYVWVTNSAHATLTDCEVLGIDQASNGTSALFVSGFSEVFALRCRFVGGDAIGPPPPPPFGGPMVGGNAVTVQAGEFAATDCEILGGSITGVFGGPGSRTGGSGLAMDASAHARLDGVSIAAGSSAPPGFFVGLGGDAIFVRNDSRLLVSGDATDTITAGYGAFLGAAVRLTNERFYPASEVTIHGAMPISGQVIGPVTLNAPAMPRLVFASTPLPSGETDSTQPVTITCDGLAPSAPFAFLFGLTPSYTDLGAPFVGALLVDLSTAAFVAGQLDPAGQFQFGFVPLALFGGPVPFPFYMQFASFDPNGDIRLSNLEARFYSL